VYFDTTVNPELAGGECLDSCAGRFIPGKEVPMPIEYEAGWTLRLLMSYTGCPRRKGQKFGRVFLMLIYTDITQNTCIQS